MSVSIDMSEVRDFARDVNDLARRIPGQVKATVEKAAVEIKKDLIEQMGGSLHFKGFKKSGAISYDLRDAGFGAEIGPEKGGPGAGANIAYFGTSRGGGTVEDPVEALNREATAFESVLAALATDL